SAPPRQITRRGCAKKRASGGFQSTSQCSPCNEMPVHSEQHHCSFLDDRSALFAYIGGLQGEPRRIFHCRPAPKRVSLRSSSGFFMEKSATAPAADVTDPTPRGHRSVPI